MHESIEPILQWIGQHPTWSGIAVFLISLSESLAIVGLVVPGVVMMTAIGGMIGAGILPAWETMGWAILGAIAGDGISYWLGFHYHAHLRDFWPFSRYPQLLARGENFFKHHGGKSIILGRFIGPVRPMIPVIAGMMDMPPRKFLFFNIASAIVWAPLYSLPGILIGVSLGTLSPHVASRVGLFILLILLALWILYAFVLKIISWITHIIAKALSHSWHHWQQSKQLPWLHHALKTAQGTEGGQLGTAILFILTLTGFCLTLSNVLNADGMTYWNEPVYQALRALYSDQLVNWVALFTGLGEQRVLAPVIGIVGLWLLWRHRITAALCWCGTIGLGIATGFLLKMLIDSPRPEGLIHLSNEHSFPSGHVLAATLTYGLAAAIIQHSLPNHRRWIPWAITIPLVFFIALSRLYLGLHWFSDIIGSLTLAIAFISLGMLLYRRFEHRLPPARLILMPGILTLCITISVYSMFFYPKIRAELGRQWNTQILVAEDWWQGKNISDLLYRNGAVKRYATVFDVQWLDSLDTIRLFLEHNHWKPVPKLTFGSSVMMLANNPEPDILPVMPKFHQDRLPVLVMEKSLPNHSRLLLQLWQSDYLTADGTSLWVGTLRREVMKHPIPLTSVYREEIADGDSLDPLVQDLKHAPNFRYRVLNAERSKIIFIKKGNGVKS